MSMVRNFCFQLAVCCTSSPGSCGESWQSKGIGAQTLCAFYMKTAKTFIKFITKHFESLNYSKV